MKKVSIILFSIVLTLLLQACSVQEKMSPQIFLDRLSKINTRLDFDTSEQFYEGDEFVCLVSDIDTNSYAFQISVNDRGDCQKISLAAEKTDEDIFKESVKSIIKVYAPDDDAEKVISSLCANSNNNQKFQYYETQWHSYSFAAEKECRYFSVSSKKLVNESNVDLSLKPNDKIDF